MYTGETPNEESGDWIHEVRAIIEASRYSPASWVPLAVIQLRGEAATWWRSLNMDPWQLAWPEFSEMFLAQFPLSNRPRGVSNQVEEAMARFVTQYAIFYEITKDWG